MESSSDEDLIMILMVFSNIKRRKIRYWEHEIVKKRKQKGVFCTLIMKELYDDEHKFIQYFRLNREQFAQVLHFIGGDLEKRCRTREVISPRERLAICLG